MKILNRFTPSNTKTHIIQTHMKKFIAFTAILSLLVSCGGSSDKGELVGAKGKKWHPEKPFGMALIPGGAFIMGRSSDDPANSQDANTKTVTVRSFYMDETEISNSEYRQFVEWVKDSTIRVNLAEMAANPGNSIMGSSSGAAAGGTGNASTKGTINDYAYLNTDPANNPKATPYDKYMFAKAQANGTTDNKLNRKPKLIKATNKYPDASYAQVMDEMYLSPQASYNGLKTMDANKLVYRYTWMDINAAAKAKKGTPREKFIIPVDAEIYPDTTAWVKDFNYSYNVPMHNDYFWHQAYAQYPVVGVNWSQARAFCAWRTSYKNAYVKKKKGRDQVNSFRLPSEAEWEFAARGGLESGMYPWGGPYTKNDKGCFLANFKPNRGDYAADNALYTVEVKSYDPNGYGLYNMAGNVAEWTADSYESASYEFTSTMNPSVQDIDNKRKVVRGGSWKDVAYYIQVSARDFEYADTARSYIGFRTIQDYMGTQTTGKLTKKVKQ
jgi:gliding motility-associated lipoprotein GldK